jgi:nucleoside-triphosphatase THEP1
MGGITAQQGVTFSDAIYRNNMIEGVTKIEGYALVDFQSDPSNGFAAAIFQNTQTGKYVVAFRGTEPSSKDILTDLSMGIVHQILQI